MQATWPVGLLFSQSGVTGYLETTQLQGALLAIEEINAAGGISGRPLQPVIHDPASEPEGYSRYARDLLAEDGVRAIVGCCTSHCRKAVLPIIERRNGLLFYPTIYEGFEYSPNVVYGGPSPSQGSVQLARYLTETYGSRFVFVGSDYVYPRECNRVMRELVEDRGGRVLDEIYLDLHADRDSFGSVVRRMSELRPDVIFSTVVGMSTIYLYEACEGMLGGAGVPIASLTTTEAEIALMRPGAALGAITAAPYFHTLGTPANRRFVGRYQARFGQAALANMSAEAAYVQTHLLGRALAQTGSMEPDDLIEALAGLPFDAPRARSSSILTTTTPICGRASGGSAPPGCSRSSRRRSHRSSRTLIS
ncbi:amino acid/amide ABC transporter substrate-binding protein, HAAT family [Rhizobiales bacterium GAS113]|nr:amino acid/amide ABC transporter substrate-binding protein, HAAT family [Rhizobiales bacterium GAS113]